MSHVDPDRVVSDFVAGRVSRRVLITQLMAAGAAVCGLGRLGRADDGEGGDTQANGSATFEAKSVHHLALNVTDVPRSRDWYMQHLGLEPTRDGRTSSFLRCGNERDFLALFKNDEPGLHHYAFAIEQYDQQDAAERLRAAGLTPKLRGGRIYFDDPDGIEVQVSQA